MIFSSFWAQMGYSKVLIPGPMVSSCLNAVSHCACKQHDTTLAGTAPLLWPRLEGNSVWYVVGIGPWHVFIHRKHILYLQDKSTCGFSRNNFSKTRLKDILDLNNWDRSVNCICLPGSCTCPKRSVADRVASFFIKCNHCFNQCTCPISVRCTLS